MPRIALSMIVKDEEKVIDRCLDSVLPFVDLFYIVDTGSTDDTKERILRAARRHKVGGSLVSRPWVDFSHNRNEALDGARKLLEETDPASDNYLDDYIMVMDADDVLRRSDLVLPMANVDGYSATYHLGNLEFTRPFLIRAGVEWKYHFPVHELLLRRSDDGLVGLQASGLHIDCNVGGAFQGVEYFIKHTLILERYLESHPDCARSQFYLAQSYHCAGEVDKAVKAYAKRTQMAGWEEEKLVSWLRIGELTDDPGAYLEASVMNNTRLEGLYGAATWCKKKGLREVCEALTHEALRRMSFLQTGGLFVDSDTPRRIQLLLRDLSEDAL